MRLLESEFKDYEMIKTGSRAFYFRNDRFFWMPLLGEEKRGRKDKANIPHESTMLSEL